MRGNEMLDVLEFIAPEYIEAADELPDKTKIKAFKPWLKWAAAVAAFIVVIAGALVAISVTGAWKNSDFVPPNGGAETPGVTVSSDDGSGSGEPESGSVAEPESSGSLPDGSEKPVADSDSHSRGGGNVSSGGEHSAPDETPDKPDDTQTPPAEEPEVVIEGDFLKDNMPAVTYRIAGESRTFVYQKSSVVKMSESGDGKPTYSVVDRYADPDGATISVNADTGDLIRYDSNANQGFKDSVISEEEALETARLVVGSTAITSNVIESVHAATRYSDGCYYVGLTYAEGSIEVCLDKTGELLYLYIISIT